MADHAKVDIIIALGMAKEGFDWVWCEHALTIGYRSSLVEIVQIIGRATRDAPGKTHARFTNLIAEPDATQLAVTEATNDTVKAIAASLLMEQVLAPRFEFKPKNADNLPVPGFDYGDGGYDPDKCNVGFNGQTGHFQIEIKGLAEPKSKEAARICLEDLNEVIAAFGDVSFRGCDTPEDSLVVADDIIPASGMDHSRVEPPKDPHILVSVQEPLSSGTSASRAVGYAEGATHAAASHSSNKTKARTNGPLRGRPGRPRVGIGHARRERAVAVPHTLTLKHAVERGAR